MKRFLAYLIALFAVCACASHLEKDFSGGMDPSLEGAPVTVTFSVPATRLVSMTKGVEGDEGAITAAPYLDPDKLYLVVCGTSQSIKYIRKAEMNCDSNGDPITTEVPVASVPDYPLTEGSTKVKVTVYSFKVQLELSDTKRTIHFLGNIDENQLITGSYSYQVLPTLVSYPGKQAYWQKIELDKIHPKVDQQTGQNIMVNGSYVPDEATESALSYVPLIRNYAEIQVTDATADEDNFELYSYSVIYFPKNGSVVPYRGNAGKEDPFGFGSSTRFSGYESCNFTTLDETLNYLGNMPPKVEIDKFIPTDEMFINPDLSDGRVIRYDANNTSQGFHIYERTIPNDNLEPTFVIIRGKFGDGDDYYYYRLDLMETKLVDSEPVYQYYPIYRNFRYNIRLNRISSAGVATPQLATLSSGAEDISADISMKHLSDISNGVTRLVVEPFMSRTYTGPSEDGFYYLYARFFNDLNSAEPNKDWGAVAVELMPMEDLSEDILTLYDDVGNEVHAFYPSAQEMGGEPGFRIIRFNTKAAGDETKTQKIRITGRNLKTHEQYPLYRDVEISLQKKQPLQLSCKGEISLVKGAKQVLKVSIPTNLPASMFPLEFIIEAERPTLTPDNTVAGNNLPVVSGVSISENEQYKGKQTIQFVRTLTREEYLGLPELDDFCSFSCYFSTNRKDSETTIWVANEYFYTGNVSFINAQLDGGDIDLGDNLNNGGKL